MLWKAVDHTMIRYRLCMMICWSWLWRGCWSYMMYYIIISSWKLSWPLHEIFLIPLCSYMSQSEGGEYPLPALFCKVTSYLFLQLVFVCFIRQCTMLIKDQRKCQMSSKLAEHPIFISRAIFILFWWSDILMTFSNQFQCEFLKVSLKVPNHQCHLILPGLMIRNRLIRKGELILKPFKWGSSPREKLAKLWAVKN